MLPEVCWTHLLVSTWAVLCLEMVIDADIGHSSSAARQLKDNVFVPHIVGPPVYHFLSGQ